MSKVIYHNIMNLLAKQQSDGVHFPSHEQIIKELKSAEDPVLAVSQALEEYQVQEKEAAVAVMQEYFPNGGRDFDDIGRLYDAIIEGKVPGICIN